jgi:cell division ATPase FtsA
MYKLANEPLTMLVEATLKVKLHTEVTHQSTVNKFMKVVDKCDLTAQLFVIAV